MSIVALPSGHQTLLSHKSEENLLVQSQSVCGYQNSGAVDDLGSGDELEEIVVEHSQLFRRCLERFQNLGLEEVLNEYLGLSHENNPHENKDIHHVVPNKTSGISK